MCFSATVVFDGTPIAEARNDGHGGSTFLRALSGKVALLAQAEAFAKGLPPAPLHLGQEGEDPHYIDMTLDFLVDELADAMHAERKVRAAFNRDIANKVLFIKDGNCCSSRASSSRPSPTASVLRFAARPAGPAHRHPRRACARAGIRPVEAACAGRQGRLTQHHRTLLTALHSCGAFSFPRAYQSGLDRMPFSN